MSDESEKKKEEAKKKIEDTMSKMLKEQYDKGLKVGMAAFAEVILKKLDNKSVSVLERIEDAKKFCNIPINNVKKMQEEAEKNKAEKDKAEKKEN